VNLELLRRIEEQILRETGNRRERVLALATDGAILFAKTGAADRVALTRAELDTLRGTVDILTHNHPSGIGIGVADFDVAIEVDTRELHAFDPRVRYRLVRPPSGWPGLPSALRELETIRAAVRRRLNTAFQAGTVSVDEYSLRYWHEVWTRFSRTNPEVGYSREQR